MELERIAAELRRIYSGEPWHGPGVMDALRDVTASQAAARPIPGAHTIYELAHHIGAWLGEVRSRMTGHPPGDPADGDFPPAADDLDDARWRLALERLGRRHEEVLEAIAAFDENRLEDPVDPAWKKESGLPVTFYAMLHGVVQHDAYHTGQIMLLKRALEKSKSG